MDRSSLTARGDQEAGHPWAWLTRPGMLPLLEAWRRPGQPSRLPRSRWDRGVCVSGSTPFTQAEGGHARRGALAGPPDTPPGQALCPWGGRGHLGPEPRLDDGALLLPGGGAGARPGQQQLLLVGQAFEQVLLAVVVVDFQESQDGDGQPGQPRGPEAELQGQGEGQGLARPRPSAQCPAAPGRGMGQGQRTFSLPS